MDHGWRHHAKRGGLPRWEGALRPPGENADMAGRNNFLRLKNDSYDALYDGCISLPSPIPLPPVYHLIAF